MSAYALVQTKNGHRLTPTATADGGGVRPINSIEVCLIREHARTDQLASLLSAPLGIAVLHTTGLSVFSDFKPDPIGRRTYRSGSGDPPAESLKLEVRTMPVEMLIVDHVETKPVEN